MKDTFNNVVITNAELRAIKSLGSLKLTFQSLRNITAERGLSYDPNIGIQSIMDRSTGALQLSNFHRDKVKKG